MKIAILCDTLYSIGGAERDVILLANALGCDIVTSGFNPKLNDWLKINTTVKDIGNFSIKYFKAFGSLIESPLRFFSNRHKFDYDVYVFIGFTSIFGSIKRKKNIWYCLTPNRQLYDLKYYKFKNVGVLGKIFLIIYSFLFYYFDQKIVKNNMTEIIAQTNEVKARIKKYYNIDTTHMDILNPPIQTNLFYNKMDSGYFLSVGRLVPEKRINMIIAAFVKLPHIKLKIVGTGPLENEYLVLANNSPNIEFLGDVSEQILIELYASCIASIYMPYQEDFGLVPIESMAAGKPCIAAKEGGCLETIQDGVTGFLIKPRVEDLVMLLSNYDKNIFISMKNNCLESASKYDVSKFSSFIKRRVEKII